MHAASAGFAPIDLAKNAPVAQLDRALDYESRGQEFESLRARHLVNLISSLSRSYSDLMSKASRKHRISTVFITKMTLRRSGWDYQRFGCGRRLGSICPA
jgi:hypothetical protein